MSYARILFESSNVESGCNGQSVKQFEIEKSWVQIREQRKNCKWNISFVIDEFAALRIALDKKEFAESMTIIILMGRVANIHIIMALQRPETSVLDGAIRDNYPVEIGLGNLKTRITKWYLSN